MMDLPELLVLDIGHGNCAVLRDTDAVTVIDCPPSSTVVEVLERFDIDTIDNILISHSDVDHAGGLPNLLKNFFVQNVYVNPDAEKKGAKGNLWKGVRIALEQAKQEGTCVHPSLTTVLSKKIHSGQVVIEILSPSPGVALGGAGGDDLEGRKLSSNSMSVVIGLVHNSYRVALLPGDMDSVGLDNLLKEQKDIRAHILVFPHHGGAPGNANEKDFAFKLCNLVQPHLVIFSIDRNRFENPRDEIMKGVVLASPKAHIMCTQLSRKCSARIPVSNFGHLGNLPAAGRSDDRCCGGSILVKMNGNLTKYMPLFADHRNFITSSNMVPNPICLNYNLDYDESS